jgi:hypothetical protein
MMTRLKTENGFALVVGMVMLLLLGFIGAAAIRTSNTDISVAGNQVMQTRAFYFAEAGAEKASADIIQSYSQYGAAPNPLPSDSLSTGIATIAYNTVDQGPAQLQNLSDGAYAGLYGLVKSYEITSRGRVNQDPQVVEIVQEVEDVLIPVFQFAVFYEKDLEFCPGVDMTINGRMHTNADMYLGAWQNLYMNSQVTAAGHLYTNHRKAGTPDPVGPGNVYVKDGTGTDVAMKVGSDWLDSDDSNWVSESNSRWDGNVKDASHGMSSLNLPVANSGAATDMIDRDNAGANPNSMENQAGLKIMDGQAYFKSGSSWNNVTGALTTAGALTNKTFYNARESKWVSSVDIDVNKLGTTAYYPDNGIIYSSTTPGGANQQATRLVNGSELPRALTVASSNPVYTLGDYNSVNKKPAAIMTDAYTVLSGGWDDAKSNATLASRVANNTTVNVAFMTGNYETSVTNGYNGGLENLPRLLETWGSSKTLTLKGSFVDLWESRQATGKWTTQGDPNKHYTIPKRNWSFDTDFLDPNKLPPGTPKVNVTRKASWRQNMLAVH